MPRSALFALTLIAATTALAACDREAGRKQETVGAIESGAGAVLGDKDLKDQGKQDKVTGQLKQGDLSGALDDAKH